jgi:hypothetical protein
LAAERRLNGAQIAALLRRQNVALHKGCGTASRASKHNSGHSPGETGFIQTTMQEPR